MDQIDQELDKAIDAVERVRLLIRSSKSKQVRSKEHRQATKAVAFAWFRSWRMPLCQVLGEPQLADADTAFRIILDATERDAARTTYLRGFNAAKKQLVSLRAVALITNNQVSSDAAPDFSPISADPEMRAILERRWMECSLCVQADAPLAATVMMGGLLEALFVARANRLTNKAPLFSAKAAPLDRSTGKSLDLRQWTLSPYIDVAHELGWITRSAKDVAGVVREYRNFIHPEKERTHKITLTRKDAEVFWEVAKSLARQLLE